MEKPNITDFDIDKLARELSFEEARIKEQQLRDGMIYLGWLPPEVKREVIDALISVDDFITDTRHCGYTNETEYRKISTMIEQALKKAGCYE